MSPNLMRRSAVAIVIALGVVSVAGAQSGGPQEGLKVHGHWIIDVRNPDGTLVSHTEFENALITTVKAGNSALAGLLGRRVSVGGWVIRLGGGHIHGGALGPCTLSGQPSHCDIVEPTSPLPADSRIFKNLVMTVPHIVGGLFGTHETGTIELSGMVTASSTTGIGDVGTMVGLCQSTVAAPACDPGSHFGGGDWRGFTSKILPSEVTVQVGQIIQVKVILSFS